MSKCQAQLECKEVSFKHGFKIFSGLSSSYICFKTVSQSGSSCSKSFVTLCYLKEESKSNLLYWYTLRPFFLFFFFSFFKFLFFLISIYQIFLYRYFLF